MVRNMVLALMTSLVMLSGCASTGGEQTSKHQANAEATPMALLAYDVSKPDVSIKHVPADQFDQKFQHARGMRASGAYQRACGVYSSVEDTIYLAPCADAATVDHEMAHAIQDKAGKPMSEAAADCVQRHTGDDLGTGIFETPRGFCARAG